MFLYVIVLVLSIEELKHSILITFYDFDWMFVQICLNITSKIVKFTKRIDKMEKILCRIVQFCYLLIFESVKDRSGKFLDGMKVRVFFKKIIKNKALVPS